MKMPKWVWGIAGVVIVLVLAVLGYAAVSRSGFVTRELAAGEVQGSEAGHYALDFFSDDGATRVANVYVRLGSSGSLCSLKLSVWHEEGTKIDGISLRFNPLQVTDALSVQAYQSGDYPAMVFRGTYDEGVLYRIDDLGFYGEGTLTFQFVLQKDLLYGLSSQPDEIWLDVDFGMQSSGVFKFSRQHAEGSICLQIP